MNKDIIPSKLQKISHFDQCINNTLLDSFKQCVTNEILEKWDTVKRPKPNLTYNQNQALRELKEDTSII